MPTFYLVIDELVPARTMHCRVRIWRHAGSPPLVLSSQVPGHPPPDFCTTRLANVALRSFLGYALPIPIFFELSRWKEKPRAFRVQFDTIGCPLRPILVNPQHNPVDPKALERIFKVKVDTPNQGVP
jgi:hypothetical protein